MTAFKGPANREKTKLLTFLAATGAVAVVGDLDLGYPTTKLRAKHFNSPATAAPLAHNARNTQPTLKGADRNAPCACGSGLKAKKCPCDKKQVDIPNMATANSPCPCGSGWSVRECRCAAIVPAGITPVLGEKTNPADYLEPLVEPYCFDLEGFIAAAEHCHGGPFPAEYAQVLETYHQHNVMKPETACQLIEEDMLRGVGLEHAFLTGAPSSAAEAMAGFTAGETIQVSGFNQPEHNGTFMVAAVDFNTPTGEPQIVVIKEVSNGCANPDQPKDGQAIQEPDGTGP